MQDLGHVLVACRVSKARLSPNVAPELHSVKLDLGYGSIGGGNGRFQSGSRSSDAENAAAGGDQNVADEASAGVQHSHTGIVPRTG